MDFNKLINSYEDKMVEKLCKIVSIPSVEGVPEENMPFGREVDRALKYTLNLCEELGFKTCNVDNYAGHADYGEGDDILGAILHLDVVPAGDNWSVDPYSPYKREDGKIYGRGTTDNKGPLIAVLYAIKALMDSGIKPKKKIRVIFGTNEETRWDGINYYLKKFDSPQFTIVPDAVFPMIYAEKGILDIKYCKKLDDDILEVVEFKGGNALNSVPDFATIKIKSNKETIDAIKNKLDVLNYQEKFVVQSNVSKNTISVSVKGTPAHASVPQDGANAICYLSNILTKVLPCDTNLCNISSFIDSKFHYQDYNGKLAGIFFEDEPSGMLTYNLGTIAIKDGIVEIGSNIRYPVTMNYEMLNTKLGNLCRVSGFHYLKYDHLKPIYQPLDSKEAKILLNAYREITNDDVSKPISIGAGTYARALKNAIAYGGQLQSDEVVPHQNDEYITSDSLLLMAKIYAKAIYDLSMN
ncbi:dipeptidase PepV [Clostridiaceae bacterium M8S5]|nr:dipeptidase PepV [Clostridiaceae bacterium M8S5]